METALPELTNFEQFVSIIYKKLPYHNLKIQREEVLQLFHKKS